MASVSSVAGVKKLIEEGEIGRDETVLCVITSTGLKFQDVTAKFLQEQPRAIAPKWEDFVAFLNKQYGLQLKNK